MLRQVLDEVAEVRDAAAADRTSLAQAMTTSFEAFERQLAELRNALQSAADRAHQDDEAVRTRVAEQNDSVALEIAALRTELDGLNKTVTDATTQLASELRKLTVVLLGPD
jgi:uncharacterized protein YjcR